MKNDMTTGSISKSLVQFTIPLILSGLLQQIFSWVDAFIVGNVEGELALAGIGATTPLYSMFVTVIIGFTSGISVLAAQEYGMGRKDELKKILSTFVIFLGCIFSIISLAGMIFTAPILTILDTPENIYLIGKEYLRILFAGIPFLAVYNTYSAILRALGDSKAPFWSILVCSGINFILDIILVAIFRYGAVGAATATAISQTVMTLFIVSYTVKKYPLLRFQMNRTTLQKTIIRKGTLFSFPPAIQEGTISIGDLILQRFMNGFGEQTVAAITTAYRIDTVLILPIINFGSGIATVVAQNIGAKKHERAKKVLKIGSVLIAIISLCLTGFILLTGGTLLGMFGLTQASVEIGVAFFRSIASCYLIYGLAMAVCGYLKGTGDMVFSAMADIISLGIRIAFSYMFATRFGNLVIGYAEAFSWVILLIMFLLRYLRKK